MTGAAMPEPGKPVERAPRRAFLPVLLAVLAVAGFLLGREVAYQSSVGGEAGIFGAAAAVGAALVATVLGSVAWLVVGATRIGLQRTVRLLVLALVAIIAAAIVGNVTAPFTSGTYHRPVQLLGEGTTTSSIRLDDDPDVLQRSGTASCRSVPDGTSVGSLDALDLGGIDGETLRGQIGLAIGADPLSIDLFIDAVNFGPDEPIPSWSGSGTVTQTGADALTGRVEFDLALVPFDPKLPATTRAWPERLSGSISWRCDPLAEVAEAPPG